MKRFLELLYLGFYNLIIAIECALSFYLGVKLFIKIHGATGFTAIGLFLLGIVLICGGVLLLYLLGFVVEYFLNNHNKEKEDKENIEDEL